VIAKTWWRHFPMSPCIPGIAAQEIRGDLKWLARGNAQGSHL
jgi:hypothetical protein